MLPQQQEAVFIQLFKVVDEGHELRTSELLNGIFFHGFAFMRPFFTFLAGSVYVINLYTCYVIVCVADSDCGLITNALSSFMITVVADTSLNSLYNNYVLPCNQYISDSAPYVIIDLGFVFTN